MTKLEAHIKERRNVRDHVALPISQERSKINLDDRTVSGYAIVWGSVNDYREVVNRGATLKSLNARGVNSGAGNKIQFLLQHDRTKILGAITKLEEDDYGLYFEASLSEGVRHSEEALIQIREKLLTQLSYGFNYIWDDNAMQYDEERDVVILNEIMLHELSLVTFSSDSNAQLRYSHSQAQLRLSQFSENQIQTMLDAFRMLSTADEAKELEGHTYRATFNKLGKNE